MEGLGDRRISPKFPCLRSAAQSYRCGAPSWQASRNRRRVTAQAKRTNQLSWKGAAGGRLRAEDSGQRMKIGDRCSLVLHLLARFNQNPKNTWHPHIGHPEQGRGVRGGFTLCLAVGELRASLVSQGVPTKSLIWADQVSCQYDETLWSVDGNRAGDLSRSHEPSNLAHAWGPCGPRRCENACIALSTAASDLEREPHRWHYCGTVHPMTSDGSPRRPMSALAH